MKSIIVYTREAKAQNLYPKRIISPPAPNKCCPARMEVLGRPRLDEQGRRFYYKRCRVCGFALRHFLDPVGTILTPATHDPKSRKSPPVKDGITLQSAPVADRRPPPVVRKSAPGRHVHPTSPPRRSHSVEAGRKSAARRRR